MKGKYLLILVAALLGSVSHSQNQAKKWFFGNKAGLDFMTSPPTVLFTGSLITSEGCATIADAAGNLLFYTDGITIYDQTHAIMANGTGLTGNSSTTQSGLIVKQPGNNNIYFVFTLGASGTGSLSFSTVDMTLAGGNGSVTIKNVLLSTLMTEKLTAVKHCNGTDVWVLAHENNNNNFQSYLVTAAGVSLTPVVSSYGTVHGGGNLYWLGNMKASPNGRKLGVAIHGKGAFEIYDFDNATGVISNSLSLSNVQNLAGAYGCEFSPDGSMFYGTRENGFFGFYQWNLCAGSPSAVAASQYSEAATTQLMGMQVATDGKIYIARITHSVLAVINNPNLAGAACNFVYNGQTIAPKISTYGLPNFINSFFKTPVPPFTFSTVCGVVNFTSPALTGTALAGCTAMGFSTTGVSWNFGDPASGAANTSTLSNPSHTYSAPGSYTTQFVIYNSCSNDTVNLPVNIVASAPAVNIAGAFSICAGEKRTYTASGASTYTWSNNLQTTTISLSPTVTTVYSINAGNSSSCTATKKFTVTVNKCTEVEAASAKERLRVYPNPVYDVLHVEYSGELELTVINHLGKVMLSEITNKNGCDLDLRGLNSGVYFLRARFSNGETKNMRIIKLQRE